MNTLVCLFNAYDKNRRVLTEAKLLAWNIAGFFLILGFILFEVANPSMNKSETSLLRGVLLYQFYLLLFELQKPRVHLILTKVLKLAGFYLLSLLGVFFSLVALVAMKAI